MEPASAPTPVRPPLWRELLLGLAGFAIYLLVDSLGGRARTVSARNHGHQVLQLEQLLHIDIEQPLNHLLAAHHVLTMAANYEYATTYVISAALMLGLSYWKTPALYRLARNSFLCLNLIAFGCFWLWPLAPPRMLPGTAFVDTVAQAGTVGSWGSPLVAHANQLAAMPSLHIAWALWVSVMLARRSHARWLQVISGIHVTVTFLVVIATANHYVLDAVGAAVAVGLAVLAAEACTSRPGALATSDEFFLSVERAGGAQNVGGYVILEPGSSRRLTGESITAMAAANLAQHARFSARLDDRERAWIPMPHMDWARHVTVIDLPPGADRAECDAAVAALHAERLPRDRPLWRMALIRGLEEDRAAFVVLLHHCMADGVGGIAQLLALVRPPVALPAPQHTAPGRLRTGAGIATGLAQLATDGTPSARIEFDGTRRLATVHCRFAEVRALAGRMDARVTELLLALTGTAIATSAPDLAERCRHRIRVSVPVMLRVPGGLEEGNSTAAVIIDTPARQQRLAEAVREAQPLAAALRSPTRALASRWVMASALRVVPRALRRGFAGAVYGSRFFHAIVSNIPGPRDGSHTLAGARMDEVYPLLPPAPGTAVTVGALTWNEQLSISVLTDGAALDAAKLADRMQHILDAALGEDADAPSPVH